MDRSFSPFYSLQILHSWLRGMDVRDLDLTARAWIRGEEAEKEAAGGKEDVVAEPMEERAGRCSCRGAITSLDGGLVSTVMVTP
jgi:hypothetical protein